MLEKPKKVQKFCGKVVSDNMDKTIKVSNIQKAQNILGFRVPSNIPGITRRYKSSPDSKSHKRSAAVVCRRCHALLLLCDLDSSGGFGNMVLCYVPIPNDTDAGGCPLLVLRQGAWAKNRSVQQDYGPR